MWISLLTLLLLLVTPISCRAEIRQEHGTRFRILLRIWGIPLRFDHSQAPMRPKPPSAQQLQKGKAMLRAVEELAAAQSFEQVVTHVYHTNRIALEMFEAAGFTQVGPPKGGNIFLRKRYLRSPFLV